MEMLAVVADKVGLLAAKQHDVASFEARCHKARGMIDSITRCHHEACGCAMLLPNLKDTQLETKHITLYIQTADGGGQGGGASEATADINVLRKVSISNLRPVITLPDLTSVGALMQWMKGKPQPYTSFSAQTILNTVDGFLYGLAASLGQEVARESDFVANLEFVVDMYRNVMEAFRQMDGVEGHMKVELRSREMLSVWIAYCVVHEADKAAIPLVGDYGVALQWKDLRHLVLADRKAWEAVLAVRAYLQQSDYLIARPLFSLRSQTATFAFY